MPDSLAPRHTNGRGRRGLRLLPALLLALLCFMLRPAGAHAQIPVPTGTPALSDTTYVPLLQMSVPGSSVYLPVVAGTGGDQANTPVRTAQSVYGLAGTLEPAGAAQPAARLRLPGGRRYTLIPATPALDRTLTTLSTQITPTVRVWGTLYAAAANTGAPADTDPDAFIVITDVVAAALPTVPGGPPTATPTPLLAVGRFAAVNLRSGPGDAYALSGQISSGMRCPITGRNAAANWIRLDCPPPPGAAPAAPNAGWVQAHFVNVVGDARGAPLVQAAQPTATPAPTPTVAATATPYAFAGWRTLFFANNQLRGVPAVVSDVPEIAFNWGTGAPRSGLPADYFSIAFERTVTFTPGFYFFTAEADDGIRFLLDGVTLLDQWSNAGAQTFRLGRELSGAHTLRVEYNEVSGAARVRFIWTAATALRWQAGYAGLPNTPGGALAQDEADAGQFRLDYNWGVGSPTGAPAGNWTARWVGRFRFEEGNYYFVAAGEDGMRLTLDGTRVLDKWSDGYAEIRNRFVGVGAGDHTVIVDYFDRIGSASLRVWWYRDTSGPQPQ